MRTPMMLTLYFVAQIAVVVGVDVLFLGIDSGNGSS
jgi:hypothetical protein